MSARRAMKRYQHVAMWHTPCWELGGKWGWLFRPCLHCARRLLRDDFARQRREVIARAEAMRSHGIVEDWHCSCGEDLFGGSAAYSAELYKAHLAEVVRGAA